MTPLEELRDRIAAACPTPGRREGAVSRLSLMRADAPSPRAGVIYAPIVAIAAQGRKRLIVGEHACDYDAANYLVVSVDMPVIASIIEASPRAPYLALGLRLEQGDLAGMLLETASVEGPRAPGVGVAPLDAELLDAALRLVRLLERPREEAAVLAPMIEREILYRILLGPQGATLRQMALAGGGAERIARVIAWLRANYAVALRIERLAAMAAMSPATLHRRFRAVTGLSPLQYQKRVRLHEARLLLVARAVDAQAAGFAVGYESASQFSREYARLFGLPPARDASRLRAAPGAEVAFHAERAAG